MIKVVFCDVDNTLVDLMFMKEETVEAAAKIFHKYHKRRTVSGWQKLIWDAYWKYGVENQHIYEKVWKDNYGEINWPAVSEAVIKYRQIKTHQFTLYPGVRETLLKIREKGIKIVALTDAPILQAYIRMSEVQIRHFFDKVAVAKSPAYRKPDDRLAKKVLKELGIDAAETLIIGDMPERDIALGKKIGAVTVFAVYGYWPGEGIVNREVDVDKVALDADYRIEDIRELLEVIKEENRNK